MRLSIIVLALALLFPFAATAGKPAFGSKYSFMLNNKYVRAHGCAVNGYFLTNAHVIDPRSPGSSAPLPPMYYRYEFRGEHGGVAASYGVSASADVGMLTKMRAPSYGYALLGDEPAIGDRIRWIEYDWRKNESMMRARGRHAKVTGVYAGTVMLDRGVTPGASGGCAYTDDGRVIGLMTFYMEAQDNERAGGIVGFWGGWWNSMKLPGLVR
jgi:hypothetical protein